METPTQRPPRLAAPCKQTFAPDAPLMPLLSALRGLPLKRCLRASARESPHSKSFPTELTPDGPPDLRHAPAHQDAVIVSPPSLFPVQQEANFERFGRSGGLSARIVHRPVLRSVTSGRLPDTEKPGGFHHPGVHLSWLCFAAFAQAPGSVRHPSGAIASFLSQFRENSFGPPTQAPEGLGRG